jgi:pyruvate,water dikinase
MVDAKRRRDAQVLLLQARQGLVLQSRALHVHAYTLAGTRIWALAAGREAMSDGRLLADNEVFFYELEEMKQMMTGEWNVSDTAGIRATAAERKAQWQGWRQEAAGDLLVGDAEALAAIPAGAVGLPGAGGTARGPLAALEAATGSPAAAPAAQTGKLILAGVQADVGAAAVLPAAGGLILAQGSPLDPTVAAAAALQIPVVYGLATRHATIQTQTSAAIDGSQGTVSQ